MTRDAMVEIDIAFVQMQEILKYVDYNLINKIPEKIRTFITEYKSFVGFEFKYDLEKPLIEQNLSQDTKNLIAYFDYYYWSDADGKRVIQEAWKRNEQINMVEEINGQVPHEDVSSSNVVAKSIASGSSDMKTDILNNNVEEISIDSASTLTNVANADDTTNVSKETAETSTDLVVRKEGFFTRIINKIKSLFKHKSE